MSQVTRLGRAGAFVGSFLKGTDGLVFTGTRKASTLMR